VEEGFTLTREHELHLLEQAVESLQIVEAVAVLGKPKKDKIEKVKFDQAVPASIRAQMNFRKLEYRNIDNFSEVYLLFLNERLHSIGFTPLKKNLSASELGKNYDADFLFMEGVPKQLILEQYEGQKETTVPKVYPSEYFMIGIKKDYAILATIDNNTWKAIWRDTMKKPTPEMFPGYVRTMQIFSRNFEGK